MSTRKLLLLALACGLAILVAGGIQILRISHNEAVTLAEGDSTEVGTVLTQVLSSQEKDASLFVTVRLTQSASAAAPLSDAGDGWSVLTGGLKEPTAAAKAPDETAPSCVGLTVAQGTPTTCVLRFPVDPDTPKSTFVTYRFVGDQATWTLAV